MKVKRGDIFFAELPKYADNVQFGEKPCVIISNNKNNYFSNILQVCPITSRDKKSMATHVNIVLDVPSIILCEQIITINKSSLKHFKCSVTPETIMQVNKAINVQLEIQNSIDINKINQMVKAIAELQNFILKYGYRIEDIQEINNSLQLYLSELKSYCYKCGVDYKGFYNPVVRELGKNASAI